MKLEFANGTELEVERVTESIWPRNVLEAKDGKILEIGLPESNTETLDQLRGYFTPEACREIRCVADYKTRVYNGYITLLSVTEIVEAAQYTKNIRLGLAAGE